MKRLIYFLLCSLVLISCRKDDANSIDGPDLNDLFGPFSIIQTIEADKKTVNFPIDGPVVFIGEISKNTQWEIKLTGSQSGATRLISGSERLFSAENASWDGGADKFPAFSLEEVYIEINFPEEQGAPTLYDTVTITGLKLDEGYLITSFENGTGTNWESFNQTTVSGSIVCGNGEAAKGDCHYRWTGTVGWDWAIGSVMIKPDSGTFDLPASASNLFCNLAFKPLENFGPDNSFILFWFDEDDDGDGTFEEASEDRFTYEYWSQDTTWDLISLKYSDLQFDIDRNQVQTNGNGLPEPAKLVSVNLFFLANPAGGNSSALVDHLIFTLDNPYRP